jgi:serine/threonine-protein kinase
LSSPRAIEAGTVLQGTYEIVRRIGVGGMGEVYEARHARLPGRFAVKVLTGHLEGGGTAFLRFRREAEIASSLRHPHIVQIVDFNQMADGAPYIVMEYLDGVDLASEMAQVGRLSPERTSILVGQIAAALAAAHAGGIVHRDLKPQNVLVTRLRDAGGDFVKVVDFGISKVKTAATLTDHSGLLGTPQYMSPEQAQGRPDDVDGRTDQFALAVMAYEMLTGRKPFTGENVPAVLFAITNYDPPPMTELVVAGTPVVEAVLRRGMGKKKEDRFASILEFSDALASAIAGRKVELPPASGDGTPRPQGNSTATTVRASGPAAGPRPSHPSRSSRRYVFASVAALLLAGGALGIKLGTRRSPVIEAMPAPRTPIPAPASPAPATRPPEPTAPPPARAEAVSPGGASPDAGPGLATPRSNKGSGQHARRSARPAPRAAAQAAKNEDDNAAKPASKPGAFIEDL